AIVSDSSKKGAAPAVLIHSKIFGINPNTIVAHAGYESLPILGRGGFPFKRKVDYFSTTRIVEGLKAKASFVDGPSRIVPILKEELTTQFSDFDQLFLRSGSLRPEDIPGFNGAFMHF